MIIISARANKARSRKYQCLNVRRNQHPSICEKATCDSAFSHRIIASMKPRRDSRYAFVRSVCHVVKAQ